MIAKSTQLQYVKQQFSATVSTETPRPPAILKAQIDLLVKENAALRSIAREISGQGARPFRFH